MNATPPTKPTADKPTSLPSALAELCVEQQGSPAPEPEVLVLNSSLARELGLDTEWLGSPEGIEFLCGRGIAPFPGAEPPVATAYAGHQFGNFAGLLGDGRALLLGTVSGPAGLTGLVDPGLPDTRASQVYELQAKGTGPTPFSRGGDGKATLSSALREYLISEAMFALNIPTTRALAVIATGENIYRDQQLPFADNPTAEIQPGGIIVRVATSHLRVGTFELIASSAPADTAPGSESEGSESAGSELMKRLIDFATDRHHYAEGAASLLQGVVKRQAEVIARWLAVGFVHGVMNTDNTTISGETIDFGPCAFLDSHNPQAVFSSIDRSGRYAYGAQPTIGGWNLSRLAEALLPELAEGTTPDMALEEAQEIINSFGTEFNAALTRTWLPKVGLPASLADASRATQLLLQWQKLLATFGPDHTNVHRALLAVLEHASGSEEGAGAGKLSAPTALIEVPIAGDQGRWTEEATAWVESWIALRTELEISAANSRALMEAANPRYIPRNHIVTKVLTELTIRGGDYDSTPLSDHIDISHYLQLLEVLTHPFEDLESNGDAEIAQECANPAPPELGAFRSYCGT